MFSAASALAAVRSDPARYDVVITDLAMPDRTGVQLAQELTAIRPDLPIILVTGYTATLTVGAVQALGIRDLLLKPLSVYALGLAVHRVLNDAQPK